MIELRDASVGYAQKPVLEHVSLAIGEGDYVVLLGENGCGKSTLVKTMLGVVRPLAGEVENTFAREMAETAMADVCTQTNPRKPNVMEIEGIIKRVTGV